MNSKSTSKPTKVTRMPRKNAKSRTGNVIGNAFFCLHLLSFSTYCAKQKEKTTIYCGLWRTHRESNPELTLRSPSQMPKLYAKCPFLFIFVRFMQYFSSILHNILLFKWWFLCLFVGSKTETLPKYYQFSQKIGYPRHIETPVFTRGK